MAEFENENVIVGDYAWLPNAVERPGCSGAYCQCGRVLYIKTPRFKSVHSIKCPNCGFVINLFCGSEGEKRGMDDLRCYGNRVEEEYNHEN